jgi:hypothetical protein
MFVGKSGPGKLRNSLTEVHISVNNEVYYILIS